MKKIGIFLHILLLIVGYSVYANQWISPTAFPYLQFVALGFPILFIINLCWVILWFLSRPKIGLLMMILSIGLIFPILNLYQMRSTKSNENPDLKLISYNVRYFYDSTDELQNWVIDEKPDVFFTQEHNHKLTSEILKNEFPFYEEYNYVSIFSKNPIIEIQEIKSENAKGRAFYADVKFENDTIRFINVYLNTTKITKNLIKETVEKDNFDDGGSTMKRRLVESFAVHEEQILSIKPFVINSPFPVIVVGDFNSVPNSYEYYEFTDHLDDVFLKVGSGLGTTFHEFTYPLRIDYVFASRDLKPISYEVKKIKLSDHFPVISTFDLGE